ncbi:MAG: TetR family transcriptional regulator [Anaerolineae bacterium]|nr:TetR family transcriptional regulator [Anaerolineae bacterium]
MATRVNENDPRVKRTRQLLVDAFQSLFEERQNFHSISVLEITERAMVNRATFYLHFADKYALLESSVRGKFQRGLINQFPASSTLQISTLSQLIESLFDLLSARYYLEPADKQIENLFELALQEELYALFLRWLKPIAAEASADVGMIETTAQIISWAICGPAVQWSRGDRSVSAKEMTQRVLRVVIAGLSPIITVT